jgi:hypothetical protein
MLLSPEATVWDPTEVTIVGRIHRTYLVRAGRRARGSRDVQRTEVALLVLLHDLFGHGNRGQREGFSFLDGDALVHLDMEDDVAPEFVETLPARCAELRSFHLRHGASNRGLESTAASIVSASPLLQRLRISSLRTKVQLTDAFGTQLGRWCPLLRHVALSGLPVTDATLVTISHDCAELQSLHLSRTYVTDAGLKPSAKGVPVCAISLSGEGRRQ